MQLKYISHIFKLFFNEGHSLEINRFSIFDQES